MRANLCTGAGTLVNGSLIVDSPVALAVKSRQWKTIHTLTDQW